MLNADGVSIRSQVQQGFTLVELVTIMIILSVISIAVYPRLQGTSGFSEFTYQARLVSALRSVQIQAMQDSRPDFCFQINFINGSAAPSFGVPSTKFTDDDDALDSCAASIEHTAPDYLSLQADELINNSLSLQATDGSDSVTFIGFTAMGRPITAESSCANGCKIVFSGIDNPAVCVESQGYVHAC